MIGSILRVTALWAFFALICKVDATSSLIYSILVSSAVYFTFWLFASRAHPMPEQEQEQALECFDMTITDAGKPIARYFGKNYPLWLEVNKKDMFVFNGQSSFNTDVTFSVSEDEFIVAPNVSYKRLDTSNQDFLADSLGITVEELTGFDRVPQLA